LNVAPLAQQSHRSQWSGAPIPQLILSRSRVMTREMQSRERPER